MVEKIKVRWIEKSLKPSFQEDQLLREKIRRETEAALKIQKAWRGFRALVEARIWRKRMLVVQRVLRQWLLRFRVKRKRKAADMIYNFLTDLQDVNRIVQVIRRFRFCGNQ